MLNKAIKFKSHSTSKGLWRCADVQVEVVKILIENEANVNLATADNWTPVHDAARGGHVAVLRALMAANADMQVRHQLHD